MTDADTPVGTPGWKPFAAAFVIGAVFLTILPFMQRQFLKAPPPVRALTDWSAESLGGGVVSSAALKGTVVLAMFENEACDAACVKRQTEFGRAVDHVDDLKSSPVVLITFASEAAREGLKPLSTVAASTWRFAVPDQALVGQLQTALDEFLRATSANFPASHAIVLIDQDNAVRGFWQDDAAGRGNSINAARLLSKHGVNP